MTFKVTLVQRHTRVHLTERRIAELRSRLGPARIAINTCNARTYDFKNLRYRDGVVIIAKRVKQ